MKVRIIYKNNEGKETQEFIECQGIQVKTGALWIDEDYENFKKHEFISGIKILDEGDSGNILYLLKKNEGNEKT